MKMNGNHHQQRNRHLEPNKYQVRRGDRSPDYRPPLLTRILRFLYKYRYVIGTIASLVTLLLAYLIIRVILWLAKLLVRRIIDIIKRGKLIDDLASPAIRRKKLKDDKSDRSQPRDDNRKRTNAFRKSARKRKRCWCTQQQKRKRI